MKCRRQASGILAARFRLLSAIPDGRESIRRGRLTPVRIDELPADAPGFDGHSFTEDYRVAVG